ncbi:MAG: hypothetical protein MJA84_10985 [Firmicutes bacterium]|nr:hypothetical protein [Bacillota bacterium]
MSVSPTLKKENTPEITLNILYATGFRLTGNHQSTKKLVQKAVLRPCNIPSPEPGTAIKNLCLAFLEEYANRPDRHQTIKPYAMDVLARDVSGIQEAILRLEPGVRLAVVLRDIAGLSYAEIAEVTSSSEKEVSGRIAAARRDIRELLPAPAGLTPLPGRRLNARKIGSH